MNDDLKNIKFSPILDYNYAPLFEEVKYNGKTLTDSERKEFVTMIDKTIAEFSSELPVIYNILKNNKQQDDEYHKTYYTVVSVMLFVVMTMIDSMVASKYFILANVDYDRRFMRGKLKVIINEGFKRLYGFDNSTNKKSEWNRLPPILRYFPEVIKSQYNDLTCRLKQHSESSSWWKEERNLETHIDAENLYESRQEEIIESKVMMDSMKLYSTLLAVKIFLTNIHDCIYKSLLKKYNRGELTEE